MADPKPKLTLVDRALEADGVTVGDATRKVLNAHAGSIAKQAKREATNDLLTKLGTQTLEDASQLAQIRAERDARVTPQEEQKHGRFRFYQGVAVGGVTAGILLSALFLIVWQQAVTTASQQARETAQAGVMMGVASQQQTDTPVGRETYERNRREPPDAETPR